MAFELISTSTVGAGGAASIDFTSIPQTYKDLMVKFSLRDNGSGEAREFYVDLNSTRVSSYRTLRGSGSAASSGDSSSYLSLLDGSTATANTFGNGELYIPNYTSSANKSLSMDAVTETNGTNGFQVITAGLSTITSAITNIKLVASSASFVQYSSATLYGVSNS